MAELRSNRKKPKKKSWKKRILLTILILFIIVLAGGAYVFYQAYDAASKSHQELGRENEHSKLRTKDVAIGKDPISIMLMGVEDYATKGEHGRADAQMILTLNPNTKKMTITSIPRDTRVELPAEGAGQYAGMRKINSAYTYGDITGYGANKLAVETAEQLLNVPIDEYVTVNFDGFRDIVDSLGGVNVNVKKGFWEKNIYQNDKKINFKAGPQKLNGEEALAFVRMRKRPVNASYSREERQRQFIQSTVNQAVSVGTLFKIGEISDILGKNVQTSLSPGEIYTLERAYSKIDSANIKTHSIDGSDQMINGGSYFIPSDQGLADTTAKLRKELEIDDQKDESQ